MKAAWLLPVNVVVVLAMTAEGCTDAGSGTDAGACGAGMQAVGTACVPVLDRCQADEVPLPGGGCKRVGVRECDGGIAGPPDWKCKRIGVEECDGGLKAPPDWKCKAIGPPTKCLTGWTRVKRGWCEPVLPPGKCPDGTMEVLGKATCQPVGDCGTDKWGKIPLQPDTVFVDASYKGGGSDGSQAKPYTTIGEALNVGTHVAVAEGTYKEDLNIVTAHTELIGRCPQQVIIEGQTAGLLTTPALDIASNQITVRGLTVTGKGTGVLVRGNKTTLEGLVVRGCGNLGLAVRAGAVVTVKSTLVAANTAVGAYVDSAAEATFERCVFSDNRPDGQGLYGVGLSVQNATATVRDCLVSDNRWDGMQLSSSTVTVERTMVRRTRSAPVNLAEVSGIGINAGLSSDGLRPGKVTVRGSVLAENGIGFAVYSSEAVLEDTVIRDNRRGKGDPPGGVGAVATPYQEKDGKRFPSAKLTMRRCLVTHSTVNEWPYSAVSITSSKGTLERTVIQNTSVVQGVKSPSGAGVTATLLVGYDLYPSLEMSDCLVKNNVSFGINLQSATAVIKRSVIRDNRAHGESKTLGDGIQATIAPKKKKLGVLNVEDCLVTGNQNAGISLIAGKGTVSRTIVRDNLPQPHDGYFGVGIRAEADYEVRVPSELTVKECLVAGNRHAGIYVQGSRAVVERTVVRDNRVIPGLNRGGYGLAVSWSSCCNLEPSAVVRDSLMQRNQEGAMVFEGARLTVERSVVCDTEPVTPKGRFGTGITALYHEGRKRPSTLQLTDTVIGSNRIYGLGLFGSSATLKRSVVRDTRTAATGSGDGTGISVANNATGGKLASSVPSKLVLQESRVAGSPSVGILVEGGSSAAIRASEVRGTRAVKGALGDGLTVTDEGSALQLEECLVDDNRRAGLLVAEGGGSARRSVFRGGTFPIHISSGAPFKVAEGNVFIDNRENTVSHGKALKPSQLPEKPPSIFK